MAANKSSQNRWEKTVSAMSRAKTQSGVLSAYAKIYGHRTKIRRGHQTVVNKLLADRDRGAKPRSSAANRIASIVGIDW